MRHLKFRPERDLSPLCSENGRMGEHRNRGSAATFIDLKLGGKDRKRVGQRKSKDKNNDIFRLNGVD